MKILIFRNIYGYPSVTPRILEYAKSHNCRVVFGSFCLSELVQQDKPTLLIAGISMLESFKIPVIGYARQPNAIWTKCELPNVLAPNEVKINVFKVNKTLPTVKELARFYLKNELTESFTPAFRRSHVYTCLNSRVFKHVKVAEPLDTET